LMVVAFAFDVPTIRHLTRGARAMPIRTLRR
jgi:hypothetical protein